MDRQKLLRKLGACPVERIQLKNGDDNQAPIDMIRLHLLCRTRSGGRKVIRTLGHVQFHRNSKMYEMLLNEAVRVRQTMALAAAQKQGLKPMQWIKPPTKQGVML